MHLIALGVFKHICFAYKGKDKVLKDVSFVIEPRQKVAIVGQSGSGKSTLAKLLFRFYDVISGEILIDGQNIKSLNRVQCNQPLVLCHKIR
jgi:ATP-binding cassette subfamily B protein